MADSVPATPLENIQVNPEIIAQYKPLFTLTYLWPYSWDYGKLVQEEGRSDPVDIKMIKFCDALHRGVAHSTPGFSMPNCEAVEAWYQGLSAEDEGMQTKLLHGMDDKFYMDMVKAYNKGNYDIAKCDALVDQYIVYKLTKWLEDVKEAEEAGEIDPGFTHPLA